MTTTDKLVRRRTRGEYRVLFPHAKKGRAIVVSILPGDLLEFREHARRDRWTLPIETAFKYALRLQAFAEVAELARERKERGLTRRKKKGVRRR